MATAHRVGCKRPRSQAAATSAWPPTMPDLTRKDLHTRVRRLPELSRLLSIEADLFKDVDVTLDGAAARAAAIAGGA